LFTIQREIADRRDFGGREPYAAQTMFFDGKHGAWRWKIDTFLEQRHKSFEDRFGGTAADLLRDDRFGKMFERGGTLDRAKCVGACCVDERSHHCIPRRKMTDERCASQSRCQLWHV